MRHAGRFAAVSVLVLCAGAHGAAEIVVGKGASTAGNGRVRVFANDANGDIAPSRVFGGPASQLAWAVDMFYEPTERVIFVSDFYGQAVRVFAEGARGDATPLRTITSPGLGQPRQVQVVAAANELVTIAGLCCLTAYDRFANGSVASLRRVQGGLTQLTNPNGLAYRPGPDELYVGDYNAIAAEILVFPRSANGDVAPSRVITGPNTQLGRYVEGLAVHPVLQEIYALSPVYDGSQYVGRIVTLDPMASGDAPPIRLIGGSATQMINVQGFDYNAETDEFVVFTNAYNAPTPAVLVFPRTGQGDIAPSRIITGPNAGFSGGEGFSIMTATLDTVFADGFDEP